MLLGGMNAAVTQETQQVQPVRASVLHQFEQKRMLEEIPAQDGRINARNLLIDDSASADIEVPDFRIAHKSVGQADALARGINQCPGILVEEIAVIGRVRE